MGEALTWELWKQFVPYIESAPSLADLHELCYYSCTGVSKFHRDPST